MQERDHSRVMPTYTGNEAMHEVFRTIDAALWEAIENPSGGIDRRVESLAGCVGILEAYIETQREALDDLLHDPRFWGFQVSGGPAQREAYAGKYKPADNRGNQAADDGNAPIMPPLTAKISFLIGALGSLLGCILAVIAMRFL